MPRRFTYSKAGVNRIVRTRSKKALKMLTETYSMSRHGKVVALPYGNIFPLFDRFIDLVIEGVGTKVLLAQLAEKYDTIGIDGVAMAVNDVIRSGAKPVAIADNIHAQCSNPDLVAQWIKGIAAGSIESECVTPSGEIGDMAELINGLVQGKGFDMVVAAIGYVAKERVITGKDIKIGDPIVGLRSSGLHSNGISLARKIMFKQWGGRYEPHDIPNGLDREIVYEALEPTRIYVKPFLNLAAEVKIKAAVHVTGDAYLKFDRLTKFSPRIGFEFDNFSPQPIFRLIQQTASDLGGRITDHEMFKTFNMGWGFAVIVTKQDLDSTLDLLEKQKVPSDVVGKVTEKAGIVVKHRGKKLILHT